MADLFDIALPAHERRGLERTVLMAVIDRVEPVPEALVELFERQQDLGIEGGQKLFADGTVMWSLQLCGPQSDFTRGVRLQP